MLRIAVCDDMPDQAALIEKAAQEYFQSIHKEACITTFHNTMDFLDAFEKQGDFDIALLDVCMPGITGTDAAKEMRRLKSRCEIIFLSSSGEFAVTAFHVQAANYLVKPFTREEFKEAMDQVVQKIRQRHSGKVVFRLVGGGIQVEELNDILFAQSEGHVQKVYIKGGSVLETRQSLTALQEILDSMAPGQFVSPGKGYLVNQKAIHVIKSEYLEIGGHHIPLTKRKYRLFSEQYFDYIFSQGQGNMENIIRA